MNILATSNQHLQVILCQTYPFIKDHYLLYAKLIQNTITVLFWWAMLLICTMIALQFQFTYL